MSKEFPDDFDPVPTPLTGSERILVEKGTATIDDVKAFARTGLPAPSAASDAATKGYVDARPGADAWSEHAATQDVDLDGHKLTGLGEPTDAADAATKGYVDAVSPTKIERSFAWGRSVAEVTDDGNIELAVYLSGQTAPLRRVRVPHGNAGGSVTIMNRSGMGGTDWVTELLLGTVSPSFRFGVSGGPSGGASSRGGVSFNGGRWRFTEQNGAEVPLGSPSYYDLPSGVSSIKHGVHLAKQAYDRLPELEWWEPVWTPVENVDSVSNVECQYTRTYRAAGGSLVTLEGTVELEALGEGQCVAEAPLPVPLAGSDLIFGNAVEIGPYGIVAGVAQLDSGKVQIVFDGGGSGTYQIPFRISYRAA